MSLLAHTAADWKGLYYAITSNLDFVLSLEKEPSRSPALTLVINFLYVTACDTAPELLQETT